MDLIFHIGFPKCASTTLQHQVFNKYAPNYLGTARDIPKAENYAKQFQRFAPIGVKVKGDLKLAKRWANDVIESIAQKGGPDSTKTLVASSELFTNWNKLKDRPIIGFLKKFSDEIWTHGDVKIVVVIRNPMGKLASGYAQVSNSNLHASQKNFEKNIKGSIQKNSRDLRHFNYSKWIKELHENFGKNNVCVLMMEEIGQLNFWKELKEFCCLDDFDPKQMIKGKETSTRRTSKYTWQLRPFDADFKAKVLAQKVFGLLWPHHISPKRRDKTIRRFRGLFTHYYKMRYTQKLKESRNSQLVLTDDLQKKIKDYYKPETEQLSQILGRDLSKYGY